MAGDPLTGVCIMRLTAGLEPRQVVQIIPYILPDALRYTVPATMTTATASRSTELTDKVSDKVAMGTKGDQAALSTAKVSLSDAVAKAETSASGKAIGAELKTRNKMAVYEVDVVGAGNKVMQVSVDSQSGSAVTKN